MSKKTIVLGYHDSLLRSSDVDLLEDKQWLNDNLIGFIYEYYEYEKYKDFANDFFFVNPPLVQIIKFSQADELQGILGDSFTKSLVFIPMNNNNEQLKSGGTHWSLLVFYPKKACCYHFDSAGHCNKSTAQFLTHKIGDAFKATTGKELIFKDASSMQQDNAYDCGIHVISNTELVCEHFLKNKQTNGYLPSDDFSSTICPSVKRRQIKELIRELSKKQPQPS